MHIGIFSLINVNVGLASSVGINLKNLLVFNCTTIGAVTCMAAIIQETIYKPEKKNRALWVVTLIAFIGSFATLWLIK